MNRFTSRIRKPVRRASAEQYLLITLLSFAASVTLTRLFLELSGYPQLGGGELHIAHVLWGGLFLFAAALAPLIVANRWVYNLGAILCGIGVGLFIDEVGKFITANNNYFYPLAAPIIYAFFLLTVLLYMQVRRPPTREARAEFYRVLEAMEEVLDRDLDSRERAELKARLNSIIGQDDQPELARLANNLLIFLSSDTLLVSQPQSTIWVKLLGKWQAFETRWLIQSRLRITLAGGLLLLGAAALFTLFRSLPFSGSLEGILIDLVRGGQIRGQGGLNWFAARLALEASIGLMLIVAAGLMVTGKERIGIALGYLGLLLSLTAVNLLIFYFDQFSTILTASAQLVILTGLTYYRRHFAESLSTSGSTNGA
jgi:hypothetical protein